MAESGACFPFLSGRRIIVHLAICAFKFDIILISLFHSESASKNDLSQLYHQRYIHTETLRTRMNEVRTRFSLVTSGQISGELLVYSQRGGDTQSKRHSCRSLIVVSLSSKSTEASSLAGHKDVQNKACLAAEGSHITEFWLLRCKWRCSVAAFGNLERWQEQPFAYLFLCPSHCRLEGDVMARATAAIWGHEVTLRMKVFHGRATNRSLGQLRAPQSRKLLLFKLLLFLSLCYLR